MLHKTAGDRFMDALNWCLLIIIAGTMFFPFLHIFSVSFSTMTNYLEQDLIIWPKQWVADAYEHVLGNERFIRSLFVTVYITLIGTVMNLIFTASMAYGLARPFYGQRTLMLMVLFTFLFSAGIIPSYLVVKATGLIDTIWALIIPGLISPWNLIVIRQFFRHIPAELHESATVDGANELRIFRSIILPLSKPALATFGLFYAVLHWNSYFAGVLYLNKPELWPIQVLLRQIVIVHDTSALAETLAPSPPAETIQMAAVLLATLPILIVYPFLQKHFAKGVMLGSVKG
ncbi:carbohydrate ABC transporter permease [Paenibacillus sp. J5C_2022]|uniref:carbohydrate ABC transporter permease n=1 Tax=Paenibacillus sp. J5C2022 TaxID=2977129 RepID=UPI0021D317C3|nr:carbohydrate ABC transporter permease [Paenibacillus sp. J5C2022]MCU6712817.1 carbohydrate ABC transporter permease [Paenibacillus sp. J5C2022]